MARNTQRGSRNNNPTGRNQYNNGVVEAARDNPFTAAVTAAAAVGAGVFLWSRRNQISEQIGQLGDQISQWRETTAAEPALESGSDSGFEGSGNFSAGKTERGPARKTQQQFAEEALTLKETGAAAPSEI